MNDIDVGATAIDAERAAMAEAMRRVGDATKINWVQIAVVFAGTFLLTRIF